MIALFSAVLLILALPHFDWTFLAPVALVPLFFVVEQESRLKQRLLYGYATGVLYWFGVCYWIQATLAEHGGMSVPGSWALFVLFCLAKGIQMGLFAWLGHYCKGSSWSPLALAALWTVLEWTHNYTGFAWLVLGNAAVDWPFFAKLAPWTGVWGISFVLALCSATLAQWKNKKWKASAVYLLAVCGLVLLLPPLPKALPGRYSALAVQPNLADETTWSETSLGALERHLAQLSIPQTPVQIVVWPEVPAPLYDNDPALPEIARKANAQFLAGVVSHDDHGGPLNSALLLSPDGKSVSRYDKVNLVPFGEFVPWPFGLVTQKISTEAGDFHPGTRVVVADRVGTFICYESVFPNYIRQFAKNGAAVLFNLSNDSWFGTSAARFQHFSLVRMRAVENHRWLLRVTNNGITAAIDPGGRVAETVAPYREVAQILHYGYQSDITFYTRWGDWLIALCALVVFAQLLSRKFAR